MAGLDNNLMIMLNLTDKSAVNLDIPAQEVSTVREGVTPNLRVLVRVGKAELGNVVPLTVLALAHDSVVEAIERAEAQLEASRRAQMQAAQAARSATPRPMPRSEAPLASRSAAPRRQSALAAFWQMPLVVQMTAHYQKHLGARTRDLFPAYLYYIANHNKRLPLETAGVIAANLLHFADTRLVVAMVIAESDFDPQSTSRVGAMGLGQLMPYTAKALGISNPYDPAENMKGSIQYLRSRLDTFRQWSGPGGRMTYEQIKLAMAAYNAGVGAVKKYNGVPPYRETQNYVRRVLSIYQSLTQGDGQEQSQRP
jgi:soluble lytic murein transglycosylase-like protein